jgi:heme/copper-type cytochrome/quinol oxidase subunit 3
MGTVVLVVGSFLFGVAVREVAGADKRGIRETYLGALLFTVVMMMLGVVLVAGGH